MAALVVLLSAATIGTRGEARGAQAAFLSAKGKIAFARFSSFHGQTSLDVIRADGAGLKRLVSVDGFISDNRISWSPDGRRIAFDANGGLYVVNADGSGLRKLRTDLGEPAWSPDGKRIAGTRWVRGRGALYVVNADGSHTKKLLAGQVGYPAWSPDGTKIAFARYGLAGGTGSDIEIANSDGSAPTRVVAACPPQCAPLPSGQNPPLTVDRPAWSPDGTMIAFEWSVSAPGKGRGAILVELGEVGVDGSGLKRLTAVHPPRANQAPAWSPDGTKIAFVRALCFPKVLCYPHEGDEVTDLYVMNADGSGQRKIAHDALAPAWHP